MNTNGQAPLFDIPNIDEIKVPTTQARHAPGFIYTSPEIYQREKEEIFMKDWLCVGREEEVEKPGDYMTFRIMDEPVLVARGRDGEIGAFSNICLHRGVEIATGNGNRKAFTCPFHGWSYDLKGQLISAPFMKDTENFDTRSCRLPPVKVGTWRGWIFINFDKNAKPLAEYVAPIEKDFGYLGQEKCRLAVKTVNEVDCNWKLVVENLIDFYHLNVVHTSTNGRTFTREAFQFEAREHGGYAARYNSGPSTPSGKPVFGRMPWLADKPDDFSVAGLLSPNFTFFARVDDVHPYITWPISPTRARIIVYTLLPTEYFGEPNFSERVEAYREFQNKVVDEDREMLESMQNAMGSKRYEPGRMSKIEVGVHHVINNYLDRMMGA